jgi:hypothetical protein
MLHILLRIVMCGKIFWACYELIYSTFCPLLLYHHIINCHTIYCTFKVALVNKNPACLHQVILWVIA